MFDLKALDPKATAVIPMDCQNGIVTRVPGGGEMLKRAGSVLEAARARNISVIHVGIGFRAGYPEVNPNHPTFGPIRQSGQFLIGTESADFHEAVKPKPQEVIVHKHRVSAFSGNDLSMILRSQGLTNLVLFGIATSGIVLSTLRQAADLDFRCAVIHDCCFDADEEVHRVLTQKVFTRQASVVSAQEFISAMKQS